MATVTTPYARSKGGKVREVHRSDSTPSIGGKESSLPHTFTQSLETFSLERPTAKRSRPQSRTDEGEEVCGSHNVQGQHIPILQRQVGQRNSLH